MSDKFSIPKPFNEPIKDYAPGSPEKESLLAKFQELKNQTIDIPLIIGGEEINTENTANCVLPHDHGHVLATFPQPGETEVQLAIDASQSGP